MVYYFKSRCGEYTIYMGKDKYENEELIKYGLPEDVWFHVDDLSSAHVYLRQNKGEKMDDITPELLLQCCSLVKANSIAGCKKSSAYVIYTRWKNLKKTSDMVEGQVSYHRPQNVTRVETTKNKSVVNELMRTRTEVEYPDLHAQQKARERESTHDEKIVQRKAKDDERAKAKERKKQTWETKQKQKQFEEGILETIEKTRQMNLKLNDDSSDEGSSSDEDDGDDLLGF